MLAFSVVLLLSTCLQLLRVLIGLLGGPLLLKIELAKALIDELILAACVIELPNLHEQVSLVHEDLAFQVILN